MGEFSVTQSTKHLCSSLRVAAGAALLISEIQVTPPGTQMA